MLQVEIVMLEVEFALLSAAHLFRSYVPTCFIVIISMRHKSNT